MRHLLLLIQMKLLWLTLNSSWSHSSLALPLVHTACRSRDGWQWSAYSATIKDDLAVAANDVARQEPDLLCAPLYIFNRSFVLELLERVKALLPRVRIVVGGPECLGDGARELLRRHDVIECACKGEGEAVIPALLDAVAGSRDPGEVAGVVTRGNLERIVAAQLYDAWEKAPAPCLDEFFDLGKPFVQVETSRGCPNRCTFCTSAGAALRYRPLEAVRQELAFLCGHGVREIRLLDRTFNAPPARAVELLRLFREDFSQMHFHLEFNPCLIPQELREELSKARPGQLHIEAGMQSMHEEVLDAIGRAHTCQRAVDGLRFLCSLTAVVVHSDLISGLPEQTLPGLCEDVRRMSAIGPGEIQLEVLKILRGTALEEDAARLGLVHSPEPPYDVMRTPWMDGAEIIEARYLSRIVDLYYNARALRGAFRICLERDGFLRAFLGYVRRQGLELGDAPSLKKRFLWLYDFVKGQHIPEAVDALRIEWMKEAFGATGICADAQSVAEPGKGVCLYSCVEEAVLKDREARYWRIGCSDGRTMLFVYHRGVAPNKAVAVFQLP